MDCGTDFIFDAPSLDERNLVLNIDVQHETLSHGSPVDMCHSVLLL